MKLRSGRIISTTVNPHSVKQNGLVSPPLCLPLVSSEQVTTLGVSPSNPHCVKRNASVSLAQFQRNCEQPLVVSLAQQSEQPLVETIYDYIIRRNGIMNEIKLHLFQLTLIKDIEQQHIQIDKICSAFIAEFDYLMKYKFEPTKRFVQLIHSKTLEWMNQYPSRRDLLFKLHDMTHI